jgi:RNA-binding protein
MQRTTYSSNLSQLRETDEDAFIKKREKWSMANEITAGKRRFVKHQLAEEKPTIWIGKSGVSQEILREIMKQLNKNKMIKVKILKTALQNDEAKKIALGIASQIGSALIDVKGHTFMLYKRRQI